MVTELLAYPSAAKALKHEAAALPSWELTPRQLCDLELLMNGGFTPLTGFMCRADYDRVLREMRLADGTLWPVPVTLDVTTGFGATLAPGARVALREPDGAILAVLEVREVWTPDGDMYLRHDEGNPVCVGGKIAGIELPQHHDFVRLRRTPRDLLRHFERMGWPRVAAYQPGDLLHRSQMDALLHAARAADAKLLIHPAVGLPGTGDVAYYERVRGYESAMARYSESEAILSLLPMSTRGAELREMLQNAIVHRNYGCTHFVVEAGDAAQLAPEQEKELGIRIVALPDRVDAEDRAEPALAKKAALRSRQGVTVFFTGLSGAGKSTIAKALLSRLLEAGGRTVTLLDGDLVRKNLSSELGFSHEHRDINIRRIGYVASEITRHGGIAICAPIAPYAATRAAVRKAISAEGGFLLVYVATPLEVCEERDRKGLYAKARAGLIKEFTGISDPYEAPEDADIVIDTRECSALQAAERVLARLKAQGYLH